MLESQVRATIEGCKVMVILRGKNYEVLEHVVQSIYDAGIRCCEIPYDSTGKRPDTETASNIQKLVNKFPDMCIGAGTVLKVSQVALTKKAGGMFIVAPDTNVQVIKKTKKLKMVSIAGALTPSECTLANRSGADFVKLFPYGEMGESYLKALIVPLSHIKFIAFGGVTTKNIASVLQSGAIACGIASGILSKEAMEQENWEQIKQNAIDYLNCAKA